MPGGQYGPRPALLAQAVPLGGDTEIVMDHGGEELAVIVGLTVQELGSESTRLKH